MTMTMTMTLNNNNDIDDDNDNDNDVGIHFRQALRATLFTPACCSVVPNGTYSQIFNFLDFQIFLRVAIITFACSVRPSLRLLHSIMATLLFSPFSLRQFLDYSVN